MENQIERFHCPAQHRDKSVVSARLVDGVVCGAPKLSFGRKEIHHVNFEWTGQDRGIRRSDGSRSP
jgi:hypothetical protein